MQGYQVQGQATLPISDLDRPLGNQEVEIPRIPKQSGHESGKAVSPRTGHLYSPGNILGTAFC
jgi:hypothetical protein